VKLKKLRVNFFCGFLPLAQDLQVLWWSRASSDNAHPSQTQRNNSWWSLWGGPWPTSQRMFYQDKSSSLQGRDRSLLDVSFLHEEQQITHLKDQIFVARSRQVSATTLGHDGQPIGWSCTSCFSWCCSHRCSRPLWRGKASKWLQVNAVLEFPKGSKSPCGDLQFYQDWVLQPIAHRWACLRLLAEPLSLSLLWCSLWTLHAL